MKTEENIKPIVLKKLDQDNWQSGEFFVRRMRFDLPISSTTYYVKRGTFINGVVMYKQCDGDFETLRECRDFIAETIAGLWD